jgi:CHAT domain-containing protein
MDLNDNNRYKYIIDRIEELEEELVSKIPNIKLEDSIININSDIISKLIPNDTILIEYVWFTPYNFIESLFEKPVYVAFVLDKYGLVNMIDLGKAEIIDNAIKAYRKSISRIVDLEKYRIVSRGMVEYVAEKVENDVYNNFYTNSKKLFKYLVEPLLSYINYSKKYIISTDSNISLITFETIIDNSDKYLIEDNDISYIDTGRDITRFSDDFYKNTINLSKVIVANPDYDFKEDIINSPKIDEKYARVRDVIKDKIIHFDDLKETKLEGEFLKNLLGEDVELLMGKDCLESSLKKLKSPKLLHLATHGFFLDLETNNQLNDYEFEYELEKYYNSLLNSGIALAGANSFLSGNKLPQEAEDGLLTSFDVTGLNLSGTNLVVLSACDTGVEWRRRLWSKKSFHNIRSKIISCFFVEGLRQRNERFYIRILQKND